MSIQDSLQLSQRFLCSGPLRARCHLLRTMYFREPIPYLIHELQKAGTPVTLLVGWSAPRPYSSPAPAPRAALATCSMRSLRLRGACSSPPLSPPAPHSPPSSSGPGSSSVGLFLPVASRPESCGARRPASTSSSSLFSGSSSLSVSESGSSGVYSIGEYEGESEKTARSAPPPSPLFAWYTSTGCCEPTSTGEYGAPSDSEVNSQFISHSYHHHPFRGLYGPIPRIALPV